MERKAGKYIQYLANQNRAYVNTLLKSERLTQGECNILILVSQYQGISQEELRQHLKIDKSAITRMVKNLVDKGYLQKCLNPKDQRSSCLTLTTISKKKMPHIYRMLRKGSTRLLEGLEEDEVDTIMRLLKKMSLYIESQGEKE